MPLLCMVAGPNGSGKSTLAKRSLLAKIPYRDAIYLNADDVTAGILSDAPGMARDDANLRAAREVDARLAAAIAERRDVIVETVLSSDKYVDDVDALLRNGFRFVLIFVCLRDHDLSAARVATRVRAGGHDVPTAKIAERWSKSVANLTILGPRAHELHIWDNSALAGHGEPQLIGLFIPDLGIRHFTPGRIPAIDAALTAAGLQSEPR